MVRAAHHGHDSERRSGSRFHVMSYLRVIPRDLFNEAKLLKCMGQLALLIHDGVGVSKELSLEHDNPEGGFQIEQDDSTGDLYCANIECLCKGRLIGLRAAYNSKKPYSLRFIVGDEDGDVFNADGSLSEEFKAITL